MTYLLLIPLIKFFGDALALPLAPATKLIHDMSSSEIRGAYILYIGAGAVAAGGIISLLRALPTIWHSLRESLRDFGPQQQIQGLLLRNAGLVPEEDPASNQAPGQKGRAHAQIEYVSPVFSRRFAMWEQVDQNHCMNLRNASPQDVR